MSRRRPGAACDLEEIKPNAFLMHNPALGPLLTGEGERNGDRFLLTTWRRDGLIARLRSRTFVVHTLSDQIARLPSLPPPPPLGAIIMRPAVHNERLSQFVAHPPDWQSIAPTPDGMILRVGMIIQQRRGRGPTSYVQIGPGGALHTLSADVAIALAYAQIQPEQPTVTLISAADQLVLPSIPLPEAHRLLLGRFTSATRSGWQIPSDTPDRVALVRQLLARLGVQLN